MPDVLLLLRHQAVYRHVGFLHVARSGVSIFPRPDYRMGFHVALYYGYATNTGDLLVYSIDNINNFGIRVGISF